MLEDLRSRPDVVEVGDYSAVEPAPHPAGEEEVVDDGIPYVAPPREPKQEPADTQTDDAVQRLADANASTEESAEAKDSATSERTALDIDVIVIDDEEPEVRQQCRLEEIVAL